MGTEVTHELHRTDRLGLLVAVCGRRFEPDTYQSSSGPVTCPTCRRAIEQSGPGRGW